MFNKVIRRFSTIHLSTPKPGIQVLTLNNPEKRNPLSMSTMTDLERQLDQIGVCPETRVIIINSKGAVFSSGHDLKEIANIHHKE
jgi:enoyl-CoA hydratase/carnithine racemase